MEPLGENWSSFDTTMPVVDSEIMAQLLGDCLFSEDCDRDPSFAMTSMFCSNYDLGSYCSLDDANFANFSLDHWPQGNCNTNTGSSCTNVFVPYSDYASYYISEPNAVPDTSCMPIDIHIAEEELQNVLSHQFEGHIGIDDEMVSDNLKESGLKRKFHAGEVQKHTVHEEEISTESPTKKVRALVKLKRSGKKAQAKKTQKILQIGDKEESNAGFDGQSSSCCSSEDDSNASQEINVGSVVSSICKDAPALNSNGKRKATRGSANDLQTLYARKRRERINERLKILQNLVPNGTKVDISTMLEEAVQYVKFLQLQIKLLSSDDLWMYAPIAYNGMNIGLNLNISAPKQ